LLQETGCSKNMDNYNAEFPKKWFHIEKFLILIWLHSLAETSLLAIGKEFHRWSNGKNNYVFIIIIVFWGCLRVKLGASRSSSVSSKGNMVQDIELNLPWSTSVIAMVMFHAIRIFCRSPILSHTRMGCPVCGWEDLLFHTRTGILYAYGTIRLFFEVLKLIYKRWAFVVCWIAGLDS